ncbi:MAG: tetratricopeptide repeat protein [Chthoniobacteraceae bacterium]
MSYLTPQQALDRALECHRTGRLAEAEGLYRQLLVGEPHNPDLCHLLGLVYFQTRRFLPGRELIERAIAMSPNVARYHNNLGTLLIELGEYKQALAAYAMAIRLEPRNAGAWYNTGIVHTQLHNWPLAIEAYRAALEIDPNYPACALNLGTALAASGQMEAGIALYRAELQRRPGDAAVTTNLGNLLKEIGDTDAAIETYRAGLALSPNDSVTYNNLAVALKDQGQLGASIAAYRRSLELNPASLEVHSNLILTLFFDPDTEPATIEAEQRRWNRLHVDPLKAQRQPHGNDRLPERRLKIGYISADFRDHVVGRALLPVFERHDRTQFELVCYTSSQRDAVSDRFFSRSDLWRDITNLSDEQVAAQIRADGIDILVDLGLHTSDNRLGVFARKPAPVQVSWLGYPGSSGVETIDYRLTDPFLEPPGAELAASAEKPWRLPDCWSIYEPPAESPSVNELPALRTGRVTFGSFNNFCKINDRVLEVWTQILRAVDGSQLRLLTKSGGHRQWAADFLRERGIDPQRLDFHDYEPAGDARPQGGFISRYEQIDIALDTFPYNGMTTTCDALWMGVPVVALVGRFSLGRAGLSLLSNVGLPELAVATPEEYVRVAVALARDLPRLATLRATLRTRMEWSPLLDADRLVRHVEAAYRAMWRSWCERAS